MVIINYKKAFHRQIIRASVLALKQGKILAYPTDTSYGLAVDATNIEAINRLYKIKGRNFNKPSSLVVPSVAFAGKIVKLDKLSSQLVKKFWPGAMTLVVKIKSKPTANLKILSAGSGFIGLRMPKNNIALDLAKYLKRPITATSANVAGEGDCYSADEIIKQFSARGQSASGGKNREHKLDIIINAGKLPKRLPSTILKISNNNFEVLRAGPITKKQILNVI